MPDIVKVSSKQMRTDARSIREQLAKGQEILNDMGSFLTLLEGCWDGEAWMRFKARMTEDIQGLEACLGDYESYVEAFESSAAEYTSAERKVYEKVHSFRV